MYLNYPNNPTGAVVPDGLFEEAVEFGRENDVLVVHDASYTETTFDGYVAPSFLATPGAKEVGVEVFSLSKGYNMTGWRTAAIVGNADAIESYWRLKTNIDSGMFDAVQLAAAATLTEEGDEVAREMCEIYQRRRDLVCDALREIGVDVTPPKGTIYIWAPVPDGPRLRVVCRARARGVRGGRVAGRRVRPERRGLLPDLADGAGRAADRGRRAPGSTAWPARSGALLRDRGRAGDPPSLRARARCAPRSRRSGSRRASTSPATSVRWPLPSGRWARWWWRIAAPRSAGRARVRPLARATRRGAAPVQRRAAQRCSTSSPASACSRPDADPDQGNVPEGAFQETPVFETNADWYSARSRTGACPPGATRSESSGASAS